MRPGQIPRSRLGGRRDNHWSVATLGAPVLRVAPTDSVTVHLMTPAAREYYDLEELWTPPSARKSTGDTAHA